MKVHEVMTTGVVTVRPDATLKEAALLLAENGISGLPVVDGEGAVLGVVSEADVLAKESPPESERRGVAHWLLDSRDPWLETRVAARTVGEAMSSPAQTISPERPVVEAATRMLEGGINRLPVVDPQGKLVGLISRGDLVRAFTRSDEEIRREIEEDLLGVVKQSLHLSDDELSHRCEQTIRNYDPCISCATHFLRLEVERL